MIRINRSLANKLIFGVSLVHTLLMTIFIGQFVYEHRKGLEDEFRSKSKNYIMLAAHSAKHWVLSSDFVGLEELASSIKTDEIESIEFINANARILFHTDKNLTGKYISDKITLELMKGNEFSTLFENDEKLILLAPIKVDNDIDGWSRIIFLKKNLLSKISTLIWEGVVYSLLAIIIGAILAWLLVRGITKDLQQIVNVTTSLRSGNNDSRVVLDRKDELQLLAHNFNKMLDHIQDEEREKSLMQGQVIDASKMASLGELAAGIAHEVNNPLAIISGSTSMLQEMENSEKSQKFLKNIVQSVDRISHIVKNLKMYSHIDINENRVFDLSLLIQQTVDMVKPIYGKDFVSIIFTNETQNSFVFGNRGHLQQIILNLMSNARHAIMQSRSSKGIIKLIIYNRDSKIFFDVEDTGGGIPEKYKDKIFESFFTTKPKGVGTGLGLAICRHLLEAMEGQINLVSTNSSGTTFRVILPVSAKKFEVDDNVFYDYSKGKDGNILILEDEEHWADILVIWLQEVGIKSKIAKNLAEFHLIKDIEKFDFYILDYLLPDGYCSDLFTSDHPFGSNNTIILTGEIDLKFEFTELFKRKQIDILFKPIEKTKLLASVTSAFADQSNLQS